MVESDVSHAIPIKFTINRISAKMKKRLAVILLYCILMEYPPVMACSQGVFLNNSHQKINRDKLTYKIIPGDSDTWGYDIFSNGKKMIHQPTKPGISGNLGFKTKKMAEKVARKIIEKMRKGEMPPSIREEELKEMGVF